MTAPPPRSRYLMATVAEDLARKMVFLGGPRQVGKTSLGKALIPDPEAYLNWDYADHRIHPRAPVAQYRGLVFRRNSQVPALARLPQGFI
jgi:predicted AAA+ superfamily ATPase